MAEDTPRNPTPSPVHVTCPVCHEAFPVPTHLVSEDGHHALVAMDRSELYGHLTDCAGKAGAAAAEDTPVPLPTSAAYVAKGKRPCIMCGATNPDCLASLVKATPCCGACGDGNTHPARHEDTPCAVWAADHA